MQRATPDETIFIIIIDKISLMETTKKTKVEKKKEIPKRAADSGTKFNRKCSMDYWRASLGVDCAICCASKPETGFQGHRISVTELRSVWRRRVVLFRHYAELFYFEEAYFVFCHYLSPLSAGEEKPHCVGTVMLLFWSSGVVLFYFLSSAFFPSLFLCLFLPGWKERKTQTAWHHN